MLTWLITVCVGVRRRSARLESRVSTPGPEPEVAAARTNIGVLRRSVSELLRYSGVCTQS